MPSRFRLSPTHLLASASRICVFSLATLWTSGLALAQEAAPEAQPVASKKNFLENIVFKKSKDLKNKRMRR